MKVILLSSFGGRIPEILAPDISGKDINWRWSDIISKIEKMAVLPSNSNTTDGQVVKYLGPDENSTLYLFPDRITVTIINVDTSRPWTILSYDGAEYIQYLDYNKELPSMNYCVLPKK